MAVIAVDPPGRHKHAAAIIAEVVPSFKIFEGKNAFAYVAKKIHRQHLNEAQRAVIAAKLADLPRGGDRGNQHTGGKAPAGALPTQSQAGKAPAGALIPTGEQAAQQLNVSPRAVDRAKAIEQQGTPQLKQALADGVVTLTKAADLAKLPAADQNDAVRELRKPKKPGKKPKSGSIKFDWKKLYREWEALYRAVDRFGNAFQCKESPDAEALRKQLREWKTDIKAIYMRLSKEAAPEE